MRKKAMWIMITVGSLIADVYFDIVMGLLLTIPIVIASWWIAYKSGWMDGLD